MNRNRVCKFAVKQVEQVHHLLEDLGLQVGGQLGVDGQDCQRRCVLQLLQSLHDLIRRHLQPDRWI